MQRQSTMASTATTVKKIPDHVLKTIQCSLAHKMHISNDPVLLSCSHIACRQCVLNYKKQEFMCLFPDCNKHHKIENADTLVSVKSAEILIESYVKELFLMAENDLRSTIEAFEAMDLEHKLNHHCNVVESEIELKVDSLKSDLDKYFDEFKRKLLQFKSTVNNSIPYDEINETKSYFKTIQRSQRITKDTYFECQDKVIHLKKLVKNLSSTHGSIFFEPNEDKFPQSVIGRLGVYPSDKILLKRRLKIGTPDIKSIELHHSVFRMCVLPGPVLCVSFSKENKLGLYNAEFELIKMIEQIGKVKFNNPRGVATNNADKVVVCDSYNSRIVMTNLGFTTSKCVGELGNGPYEFNAPYDAYFHENFIYVCDCKNDRIQKFSDELIFIESYSLGYCPFQIRIISDTICIRDFDDHIYFYDTDRFYEKETRYDNNGIIAVLDDKFLQLDFKLEKIYIYNHDGNLGQTWPAKYTSYKNCDMCVFNDTLVITGRDNNLIII